MNKTKFFMLNLVVLALIVVLLLQLQAMQVCQ